MNIEGLKKRKEMIEKNLKTLKDRITQDTQNALRLEGALMDTNELIAEIEKEDKEKETKKKAKEVK